MDREQKLIRSIESTTEALNRLDKTRVVLINRITYLIFKLSELQEKKQEGENRG